MMLSSRVERLEQGAGLAGRNVILQCGDQSEADIEAALLSGGVDLERDTLTVVRWPNTSFPIVITPEPPHA